MDSNGGRTQRSKYVTKIETHQIEKEKLAQIVKLFYEEEFRIFIINSFGCDYFKIRNI